MVCTNNSGRVTFAYLGEFKVMLVRCCCYVVRGARVHNTTARAATANWRQPTDAGWPTTTGCLCVVCTVEQAHARAASSQHGWFSFAAWLESDWGSAFSQGVNKNGEYVVMPCNVSFFHGCWMNCSLWRCKEFRTIVFCLCGFIYIYSSFMLLLLSLNRRHWLR